MKNARMTHQHVRTNDASPLCLLDLVRSEIGRQIQCHEVFDIRVDFLQLRLVSQGLFGRRDGRFEIWLIREKIR
jgi:hypothetical protein